MTNTDPLSPLWHFTADIVASDKPDLTQRQMAVLLTVYLNDEPQTVRGLASAHNISKPAVTRALDRLAGLDFIYRKIDPDDRRSIFIRRTAKGERFLAWLRERMTEAKKAA